jgi:hypothetical protein
MENFSVLAGYEPSLAEMMEDPVVRSLMHSDHVEANALMPLLETVSHHIQFPFDEIA